MSHEQKILVTLDFDGVVSPLPKNWHPPEPGWVNIWEQEGADDPYPWHTFEFGFPCSIRENVGAFLHELNAMPDVDVVWLTSWDQGTQYFEEISDGFVPHYVPDDDELRKNAVIKEMLGRTEMTDQAVLDHLIDEFIDSHVCKTSGNQLH